MNGFFQPSLYVRGLNLLMSASEFTNSGEGSIYEAQLLKEAAPHLQCISTNFNFELQPL